MAAPGTTGSHSTSSRVIRSFLAQPLDVIRSIRSSYSSNNVYLSIYLFFFQIIAAALWLLFICLAVLVVYCTYSKYVDDIRPWNSAEMAAYEALSRPVWSLCVAWVIYACSSELAGMPIRIFLFYSKCCFVMQSK